MSIRYPPIDTARTGPRIFHLSRPISRPTHLPQIPPHPIKLRLPRTNQIPNLGRITHLPVPLKLAARICPELIPLRRTSRQGLQAPYDAAIQAEHALAQQEVFEREDGLLLGCGGLGGGGCGGGRGAWAEKERRVFEVRSCREWGWVVLDGCCCDSMAWQDGGSGHVGTRLSEARPRKGYCWGNL